jgi:hypothetical protein
MKNIKLKIGFAAIVFSVLATLFSASLISCQSTTTTPQSWSTDMQKFAQALAESMPVIHKSPPFFGEDREKIIAVTEKFQKLSKSVNHNQFAPSKDPSFLKAATALEDDLNEIRSELQQGNDRHAARRLASVTQYCISCHTMREGYEGEMSRSFNRYADGMPSVYRAEYFAATRQFDLALLEYEKILSDANVANKTPKVWDDAALKMLAIIVRVKNNPNLALEMLSRFFDVDSYPKDLRNAARVWQQETKKWEASEKTASTKIALSTVEKLIAESEKLKPQHAGLIQDLRASRIMHLLKSGAFQNKSEQQKLYFHSGQVAQRLHDLNIWEQPQDYFVMCVRAGARTATAQKCRDGYKNYWQGVLKENNTAKWPSSTLKEWQSLK